MASRPPRPVSLLLVASVAAAGCAAEPQRLACDGDAEVVAGADRDVLFAAPESPPRGLAVLLHGLAESACNWTDRVEEARVADAALERGLAWVAADSADGAWDVDLDSEEVASVDAAIAAIEADGRLPEGLPTLALGHSNGGAFAQIFAVRSRRDVVAVVNANGWGTDALDADESPPPMLFITAENDTIVRPAVVLDAATAASERGHDLRIELHVPTPLQPDRFARVPGIDVEASADLVATYDAAGLLDGAGRPAVNPRTDPRWSALVPEPLEHLEQQVVEQIHVVFAEHRFSSADIEQIFALFDEAVP